MKSSTGATRHDALAEQRVLLASTVRLSPAPEMPRGVIHSDADANAVTGNLLCSDNQRLLLTESPMSVASMRVELAALREENDELRARLSLAEREVEWAGGSPAAQAVWRWRRTISLRSEHAATVVRLKAWEGELQAQAELIRSAATSLTSELSALRDTATRTLDDFVRERECDRAIWQNEKARLTSIAVSAHVRFPRTHTIAQHQTTRE